MHGVPPPPCIYMMAKKTISTALDSRRKFQEILHISRRYTYEEPYCTHLHKQISHGAYRTDAIPLVAVLAACTSVPRLTSPACLPSLNPASGPVGCHPDA